MTERPPPTGPVSQTDSQPGCGLDAEALAAFIDGRVSADVAAMIEVHLTQCEACRWVAAESVRSTPVRSKDR